MADPARARKLADRVKEIVADALEKRIKDPRLGFLTVTDVRMTPDLQHASVFYTVMGDDEARQSTQNALVSATGVLRTEVGRRTGVRLTPTLTFILDAVPEGAAHLEELLREARARDAEVAAAAAGATYAGDPDPYRTAEEVSADLDAADADDDTDDDADDDDAVDEPDALRG